MNYESVAAEVVEKSGGAKNIKTVAHCATRLRFTLVDKSAADMDAIKKIPGVLGCIYATEQLQIVFGKNVLGVYNAVLKDSAFADAGEVQPAPTDGKDRQPLTVRSAFDAVIGFIAGSVAHLVPGLIAGGMLKVFLLLITYAVPSFAETDTYTILGWVANAPFYFMPIFVAYGAARKLDATPIYAMDSVASLLTPAFTTAVAEGTSMTMIGIPVRLVRYPQQLLPALLIAFACCYIEKILNKIVPGDVFYHGGT